MSIGAIDQLTGFFRSRAARAASEDASRAAGSLDQGLSKMSADSISLSTAARTAFPAAADTKMHTLWPATMDVTSVPVLDPVSPLARRSARQFIDSRSPAFERSVAGLDQATGQRITALRQAVTSDPLSEAAVLRLQLSGKLSGPEGAALLGNLEAIAKAPLADGLDRNALLTHTLQEIDQPARITQGIKMTCEATSVQILLAQRDPAEYTRLIAGLASPEGTVTLKGGQTLSRVSDWASRTDGYRSESSRLLQPSFATYGNGPLHYDNTHDANDLGKSGLTDPQLANLSSAVFGTPFKYLSPENSTAAERMDAYKAATQAGWSVPTWLNWATGHVVLAEPEQAGRVVIDNPFGLMHTMQPDAFQNAIHTVYVPTATRG